MLAFIMPCLTDLIKSISDLRMLAAGEELFVHLQAQLILLASLGLVIGEPTPHHHIQVGLSEVR